MGARGEDFLVRLAKGCGCDGKPGKESMLWDGLAAEVRGCIDAGGAAGPWGLAGGKEESGDQVCYA